MREATSTTGALHTAGCAEARNSRASPDESPRTIRTSATGPPPREQPKHLWLAWSGLPGSSRIDHDGFRSSWPGSGQLACHSSPLLLAAIPSLARSIPTSTRAGSNSRSLAVACRSVMLGLCTGVPDLEREQEQAAAGAVGEVGQVRLGVVLLAPQPREQVALGRVEVPLPGPRDLVPVPLGVLGCPEREHVDHEAHRPPRHQVPRPLALVQLHTRDRVVPSLGPAQCAARELAVERVRTPLVVAVPGAHAAPASETLRHASSSFSAAAYRSDL